MEATPRRAGAEAPTAGGGGGGGAASVSGSAAGVSGERQQRRISQLREEAACADLVEFEWLRQFYGLLLAWRGVLAYERAHTTTAARHDWYVKTRPDLVHLQPLLSLDRLDRDVVHVPSGVMTAARQYQVYNDHMLLCAARSVCNGYFNVVETTYLDAPCNGSRGSAVRMPWPPQALFAGPYLRHGAPKLFEHAYTVARPATGPECNRLDCNRADPFATGCVAAHLPQHAPRCRALASRWNDTSGNAVGKALRVLFDGDHVLAHEAARMPYPKFEAVALVGSKDVA